jgi:hypothetical protein
VSNSLKHGIKLICNRALGFGGHYLRSKVRFSELKDLLRTLRPYQPSIPLEGMGRACHNPKQIRPSKFVQFEEYSFRFRKTLALC